MTVQEHDAMMEAKGTPKVWQVSYAITCPGLIHSELFETEAEARAFAAKRNQELVVSCSWVWDIWGWTARRKKAQRAAEYKAMLIRNILEWQTRNQFTQAQLEKKSVRALEIIHDNID